MSLLQELKNADKGLPFIDTPSMKNAVHWVPSENFPIHRWFRYREGYSPYLFEYFPDSKHRFDPFCGCGTTLLESYRQGIKSTGIDVNPLATFISKVKTRNYSALDRKLFEMRYIEVLNCYNSLEPAQKPDYSLLDKLFLPESMDVLLKLKAFIDTVDKEVEQNVHDLLLLAWLAILEDSSNVYKEGNGLKYRNKRRRPGKYETLPDHIWIPSYFGSSVTAHVINLWKLKCEQIIGDIKEAASVNGTVPDIRTGSCLNKNNIEVDTPVDLAIFSPPYANRFDYFEAFKLELWMGGFVKNKVDIANLRKTSMRNNLAAGRDLDAPTWSNLDVFLNYMDPASSSVRMGIKKALQGYFEDTRILLKNLNQVLAKKGIVAIVVGNSAYAKSIIPTDTLIAHIGQEEGYKIKKIHVARQLHVSSQQRSSLSDVEKFMRESVIILEKP